MLAGGGALPFSFSDNFFDAVRALCHTFQSAHQSGGRPDHLHQKAPGHKYDVCVSNWSDQLFCCERNNTQGDRLQDKQLRKTLLVTTHDFL